MANPLPSAAAAAVAPPLLTGEVHLWLAELARSTGEIAALTQTLSPDEFARADRFRRPRDRDRFIVARGLLRSLLGRYAGLAPAALRFEYHCECGDPGCATEWRKPTLAAATGGAWLHFNVAHSGDLALYALARDCTVGVDLEWHDPAPDPATLAPIVLAPNEWVALRALPAEAQRAQFFRLWTAKEAYLKARGTGLCLPPAQVSFDTGADGALRLLSVAGDVAEAARWHLTTLAPQPGYSAAVVSAGPAAATPVFALAPARASAL